MRGWLGSEAELLEGIASTSIVGVRGIAVTDNAAVAGGVEAGSDVGVGIGARGVIGAIGAISSSTLVIT